MPYEIKPTRKKIIDSCKTIDQLNTCIDWVNYITVLDEKEEVIKNIGNQKEKIVKKFDTQDIKRKKSIRDDFK